MRSGRSSRSDIADLDQMVGEPIAQTVLVEHRHDDVDVGLVLNETLPRVLRRALGDALELDAVALLERPRQRDEIPRVHLHRVGMTRIADDLIAMIRNLAADGSGPVSLRGLADEDDRTAVRGIRILEGLESGHDLAVVVAIRDDEDVPAVRGPLLDQPIAVVLLVDHAAEERVVDTGVVVRDHHAQALARLQRERLRLQLLRVTLGHRELAFERDDLRPVHRRAGDVPERGLAGGGGDADARGAAVDVVGDVDALGVSGERLDAACLGLCEERRVGESLILQQRLHRPGAAAESERIDRQDRDRRIDVVTAVARGA